MKRVAVALAALLAAVGVSHATEPQSPFDTHPSRFVQLPHSGGFIVGVCNRDRTTLLDELRYRRGILNARRGELSAAAGNGHLTPGDIALTIILPGGLLYAAQRHDTMRRARIGLDQVEARIQELSTELQALNTTAMTAKLQ